MKNKPFGCSCMTNLEITLQLYAVFGKTQLLARTVCKTAGPPSTKRRQGRGFRDVTLSNHAYLRIEVDVEPAEKSKRPLESSQLSVFVTPDCLKLTLTSLLHRRTRGLVRDSALNPRTCASDFPKHG